jgi:hypothetical protein
MTGITVDDFLLFSDRTIDGFIDTVGRLDDDSVNQPPFEGASSAAALTTHAMAAAMFWCDHVVVGNPTSRDRDSEFVATATVADLQQRCTETKAALRSLGPQLTTSRELHGPAKTQTPLGQPWTIGAALIHAYEELAQHLGHVEMTADVLLS